MNDPEKTNHEGVRETGWESLSELVRFQVAPGISKEAEFKRLTGEDWPGVNWIAESSGVDDDGYDQPIETWTVRRRTSEEMSEPGGGESIPITIDGYGGGIGATEGSGIGTTGEQEKVPGIEGETSSGEGGDEDNINRTKDPADDQAKVPTIDETGINTIKEPVDDQEKVSSVDETDINATKEPIDDQEKVPVDKTPIDGTPDNNTSVKGGVELGETDIPRPDMGQETSTPNLERLQELVSRLEECIPDLAEQYARNRRLVVTGENRADFAEARAKYEEALTEYLQFKAVETYAEGQREIAEKLEARFEELTAEIDQKLLEFVGGDPEHTEKTQEEVDAEHKRLIDEAIKKFNDERGAMIEALGSAINADFIEDYIEQALKLEEATIDRLDNGTACRLIISKIISDPRFKAALLIGAGVAATATAVETIPAIMDGSMEFALNYTLPSVLAAATKGASMGAIMSRQSSEKSAIHGFGDAERIKEMLSGINILDQSGQAIKNVVTEGLDDYEARDAEDRKVNEVKTGLSAFIGGLVAGVVSGFEFNDVSHQLEFTQQEIGQTPIEYRPDVDIEGVYHQAGGGIEAFCVNEAKLVSSSEEFYAPGGLYDIIIEAGGHHGLVEGSDGGWSYEGTLSDWLTSESSDTMR